MLDGCLPCSQAPQVVSSLKFTDGPGLVVSPSREYSKLSFHRPQSRAQHNEQRYSTFFALLVILKELVRILPCLKMSCKPNGASVSPTQVDSFLLERDP